MAAHKAALDIFMQAKLPKLIQKSKKLTSYLEFIIREVNKAKATPHKYLEIITPAENRGCQLSVVAHGKGKELFNALTKNGIITDWREPNVIRCAPVPLYNSFEDVYKFGHALIKSW
jgi:kynureninase